MHAMRQPGGAKNHSGTSSPNGLDQTLASSIEV